MSNINPLFEQATFQDQLSEDEKLYGGGAAPAGDTGEGEIASPEGSQVAKTATPEPTSAPESEPTGIMGKIGAAIQKVGDVGVVQPIRKAKEGIKKFYSEMEPVSDDPGVGGTAARAGQAVAGAIPSAAAEMIPDSAGQLALLYAGGKAIDAAKGFAMGVKAGMKGVSVAEESARSWLQGLETRQAAMKPGEAAEVPLAGKVPARIMDNLPREAQRDPSEFFPAKAKVPDAQFAYDQEIPESIRDKFEGRASVPFYHITKKGHEAYQSTVTSDTLKKYGLETPAKATSVDAMATEGATNPETLGSSTFWKRLEKGVMEERESQGSKYEPQFVSKMLGRELNVTEENLLTNPNFQEGAARIFAIGKVADAAKNDMLHELQQSNMTGAEPSSLPNAVARFKSLSAYLGNALEDHARAMAAGGAEDIKSITKLYRSYQKAEELQRAINGAQAELTPRQAQAILNRVGATKTARILNHVERYGWDAFASLIVANDMAGPATLLVNIATSITTQPVLEYASRVMAARLPKRALSDVGKQGMDTEQIAPGNATWYLYGFKKMWSNQIKDVVKEWNKGTEGDGYLGGMRTLWRNLQNVEPLQGSKTKLDLSTREPAISTKNYENFRDMHPSVASFMPDSDGVFKPAFRLMDAMGKGMHGILQGMEGGDRLGFAPLKAAVMHARAFNEIALSGRTFKNAQELEAAVNESVAMKPKVYTDEADRLALHQLYRDPIAIPQALRHPIWRFEVPFMKIGINLVKTSLEGLPMVSHSLKFVRDEMAAGGGRAQLAQARMMIGSAIFSGSALAGGYGYLTGHGPKNDPEAMKEFMSTNVPVALRIRQTGDVKKDFIGLQNILGQVGITLSLGAQLGTLTRQIGEHAAQDTTLFNAVDWSSRLQEAGAGLVATVIHGMADNMFTADLFKAYDMINQDPGEKDSAWWRKLEMHAEKQSGQLLPFHNFLKDRNVEIAGLLDDLESTYWSHNMDRKLDWYGRYVPSIWGRLLGEKPTGMKDYSWVDQQINEHAPHLYPTPNVINNEVISAKERHDWKDIRGNTAIGGMKMGDQLLALKDNTGYQAATNGPGGAKADYLSSIVKAYSEMASAKMASHDPKWLNKEADIEHAERRLGTRLPQARKSAGVRIAQ